MGTGTKTIVIEVKGGVVIDVRNLPNGYNYIVKDRDVEEEEEDVE